MTPLGSGCSWSPDDPVILVGALAAALGSSRSAVLRDEKAGRIAKAPVIVRKRWRGWPLPVAAEIVRARGFVVPGTWGATPVTVAA